MVFRNFVLAVLMTCSLNRNKVAVGAAHIYVRWREQNSLGGPPSPDCTSGLGWERANTVAGKPAQSPDPDAPSTVSKRILFHSATAATGAASRRRVKHELLYIGGPFNCNSNVSAKSYSRKLLKEMRGRWRCG